MVAIRRRISRMCFSLLTALLFLLSPLLGSSSSSPTSVVDATSVVGSCNGLNCGEPIPDADMVPLEGTAATVTSITSTSFPGVSGLAGNAFNTMILEGNTIWLFPRDASHVVTVDKNTGTKTNYGAWPFSKSSGHIWGGVVKDPNSDLIWLTPYGSAAQVMSFSTSSGAMVQYGLPSNFANLIGSTKWNSAVYANGHVWGCPHGANSVLQVDVSDGSQVGHLNFPATTTITGVPANGMAWNSQDHIWLAVRSTDEVIRVDIRDGSMMGYGGWPVGFVRGGTPFYGACFDGRYVWFAPRTANGFLYIDDTTQTMATISTVPPGVSLPYATGFGTVVFDGKFVWFGTWDSSELVRIDTTNFQSIGIRGVPAKFFHLQVDPYHNGGEGALIGMEHPTGALHRLTFSTPTATETESLAATATKQYISTCNGITCGDRILVNDRNLPFEGDTLIEEDLNENNWSGITLGGLPWSGSVLVGDSLWLTSRDADKFARIHKTTGAITINNLHFTKTTSHSWAGIVKDPDSTLLWLAPYRSTTPTSWDTSTGTTVSYSMPPGLGTVPVTQNNNWFNSAAHDDNGYMWACPHNADGVMQLNMADGTSVAHQSWPVTTTFTSTWRPCHGVTFDEEDHIWLTPREVDEVTRVSVHDGSMIGFNGWPASVVSPLAAEFLGATFDNKYIWFSPKNHDIIVKLDPTTGSMVGIDITEPGVKFSVSGGSLRHPVFDGKYVWFASNGIGKILRVNSQTHEMTGFPVSSDPQYLLPDPAFDRNGRSGGFVAVLRSSGVQKRYVFVTGTRSTSPTRSEAITSEASPTRLPGIIVRDSWGSGRILPPGDHQQQPIHERLGTWKEFNGWPVGFSPGSNPPFIGGILFGDYIWGSSFRSSAYIRVHRETGVIEKFDNFPANYAAAPCSQKGWGMVLDYTQHLFWSVPYSCQWILSLSATTGSIVSAHNSWPSCVLESANGLPGFVGGGFERNFLWLAPWHGRCVTRLDMRAPDTTPVGLRWSSLSGLTSGHADRWFHGGAFDGNHMFFGPATASAVLRVNVHDFEMKLFDNWPTGFGSPATNTRPSFTDTLYDGSHVWLIPDEQDEFIRLNPDDETMVRVNNFPPGYSSGTYRYRSASFDGRYLWCGTYSVNMIIRIDTVTLTMRGFDNVAGGSYGAVVPDTEKRTLWFLPYTAGNSVYRVSVMTESETLTPGTKTLLSTASVTSAATETAHVISTSLGKSSSLAAVSSTVQTTLTHVSTPSVEETVTVPPIPTATSDQTISAQITGTPLKSVTPVKSATPPLSLAPSLVSVMILPPSGEIRLELRFPGNTDLDGEFPLKLFGSPATGLTSPGLTLMVQNASYPAPDDMLVTSLVELNVNLREFTGIGDGSISSSPSTETIYVANLKDISFIRSGFVTVSLLSPSSSLSPSPAFVTSPLYTTPIMEKLQQVDALPEQEKPRISFTVPPWSQVGDLLEEQEMDSVVLRGANLENLPPTLLVGPYPISVTIINATHAVLGPFPNASQLISSQELVDAASMKNGGQEEGTQQEGAALADLLIKLQHPHAASLLLDDPYGLGGSPFESLNSSLRSTVLFMTPTSGSDDDSRPNGAALLLLPTDFPPIADDGPLLTYSSRLNSSTTTDTTRASSLLNFIIPRFEIHSQFSSLAYLPRRMRRNSDDFYSLLHEGTPVLEAGGPEVDVVLASWLSTPLGGKIATDSVTTMTKSLYSLVSVEILPSSCIIRTGGSGEGSTLCEPLPALFYHRLERTNETHHRLALRADALLESRNVSLTIRLTLFSSDKNGTTTSDDERSVARVSLHTLTFIVLRPTVDTVFTALGRKEEAANENNRKEKVFRFTLGLSSFDGSPKNLTFDIRAEARVMASLSWLSQQATIGGASRQQQQQLQTSAGATASTASVQCEMSYPSQRCSVSGLHFAAVTTTSRPEVTLSFSVAVPSYYDSDLIVWWEGDAPSLERSFSGRYYLQGSSPTSSSIGSGGTEDGEGSQISNVVDNRVTPSPFSAAAIVRAPSPIFSMNGDSTPCIDALLLTWIIFIPAALIYATLFVTLYLSKRVYFHHETASIFDKLLRLRSEAEEAQQEPSFSEEIARELKRVDPEVHRRQSAWKKISPSSSQSRSSTDTPHHNNHPMTTLRSLLLHHLWLGVFFPCHDQCALTHLVSLGNHILTIIFISGVLLAVTANHVAEPYAFGLSVLSVLTAQVARPLLNFAFFSAKRYVANSTSSTSPSEEGEMIMESFKQQRKNSFIDTQGDLKGFDDGRTIKEAREVPLGKKKLSQIALLGSGANLLQKEVSLVALDDVELDNDEEDYVQGRQHEVLVEDSSAVVEDDVVEVFAEEKRQERQNEMKSSQGDQEQETAAAGRTLWKLKATEFDAQLTTALPLRELKQENSNSSRSVDSSSNFSDNEEKALVVVYLASSSRRMGFIIHSVFAVLISLICIFFLGESVNNQDNCLLYHHRILPTALMVDLCIAQPTVVLLVACYRWVLYDDDDDDSLDREDNEDTNEVNQKQLGKSSSSKSSLFRFLFSISADLHPRDCQVCD